MRQLGLLLDFDGTLYTGDLPVQAYGRRVAQAVAPADADVVIAGLRVFLEGRGPVPAGLKQAQDGYHAVHLLAAQVGLAEPVRQQAYEESRHDLARSAFALEAVPGLREFLTEIKHRTRVVVLTNAPPAGVHEVLEAVQIRSLVDEVIVNAGKPQSLPLIIQDLLTDLGAGADPRQLLAIGDRWLADLADVHTAGGATAYVDRHELGDGAPTWRATELQALIPRLRHWAELTPATR